MFKTRRVLFVSAALLLIVILGFILFYLTNKPKSHDWPMWRYDVNRSASSPQKLSDKLYLQWVREYPKLSQVWKNPLNRDLMQYDKVYEPIVQDKTLFVGSNSSDRIVALNTETGKEKWRFYADGPVRFSPVAYNNRIYFVSDDGYIYCLDTEQGKLIWKFHGSPSERKILGNERLISTWPARGGPVVKDGIVYFSAGIWPFMGIFIYALDAETGEIVWENDSTGSIYMLQPHNSPSYAGVAPQGNLVISGNKLLVPCGRSVPACFDRHTGELLYYHLARYNKTGGAFVCAVGDFFINYHRDSVTNLYQISDGNIVIPRFGNVPVVTENNVFSKGNSITAYDLKNIKKVKYKKIDIDKKNQDVDTVNDKRWILNKLWQSDVDASGDLIKAGNRLYAGGRNVVSAIDIPGSIARFFGKKEPEVTWQTHIDGTAGRLVAADNKLFVVTLEGNIYAFSNKENTKPVFYPYRVEKYKIAEDVSKKAESILQTTGISDGYCLVYQVEDGELVEALARKSNLHIIAVEPNLAKVERLRRRFDETGLYGKKVSIHVGDASSLNIAPYLASLTVFENFPPINNLKDKTLFKKIYQTIRPYGGVLCLSFSKDERTAVIQQIKKNNLPKAVIKQTEDFLLLIRDGSLPNSDDWTHQYGNIANTVKSDDKLVKPPLGILWFGGSSNMDVLPRHGHGPPEQVIGGKLFIQGIDSFSARDVYTGRILWKRHITELNTFNVYYDETYKNTPLDTAYNQVHIPGANARGTNFVATLDKVYIAKKNSCLVLDSATGKTIDEFKLKSDPKTGQTPEWGYIGVYKDYLIAGAGLVKYVDLVELDEIDSRMKTKLSDFYNFDITSSKRLVVMDRHTGKVIWTKDSELGFRHNAIAVGNERVFCIDTVPEPISNALKRRLGKYHMKSPELMALNLHNGRTIWETDEDIFGTWLSYSEEYDVLLQAGRSSRDMIIGEPQGMKAYRGKDGILLWKSDVSYGGPCMLHGDKIITDQYAYSLLTGEQKMRIDPLTGEEKPWEFRRNYGCNYAIASEHLLTFRSAAAGFYDLMNDGGTGNFGGFKSSCTSNLIVANGVLNAPDYTRTCSCSYQNQTSLALIHMPEVEMWTTYFGEVGNGNIRNIGINLGAPGDRRTDNGTLWIEYPRVGGPSPDVPVNIKPENYQRYCHHSSKINGDKFEWIAASGLKGISSIEVKLEGNTKENDADEVQESSYTVRLYFSEPENIESGQRVFDVSIQGKRVLKNFDIVGEAGEPNVLVVKEFRGITVKENLTIEFTPSNSSTENNPLICGIEVLAYSTDYLNNGDE